MTLVDSDILIDVTRGRDAAVLSRWRALAVSDETVLCSVVSVAELWHGAKPSEHTQLTALFDSLVCVPIDFATARIAGDLLRQYRKSHSLQLGDALIAASALLRSATLWTRNHKHYPMKGLTFFQ